MFNSRPLSRLAAHGLTGCLILAEAAVALAMAAAVIRFLPFRRAIRFGSIPLWRTGEAPVDSCYLAWAVARAAHAAPFRAVCFQQGLALQRMLRRRGANARLHYGITKVRSGNLAAHVWVTEESKVVIGGIDLSDYREVAVYP